MPDWEHLLKPLGFIALYLLFAWAVRAALKPFFPNGANWVFLLLVVAGFVLMYYVYYEAYYFLREIVFPSGASSSESADIDSLLQPVLYALAALLMCGSLLLYSQSLGADPEFYPPLGLGLLFLVGGLLMNYFDESED